MIRPPRRGQIAYLQLLGMAAGVRNVFAHNNVYREHTEGRVLCRGQRTFGTRTSEYRLVTPLIHLLTGD